MWLLQNLAYVALGSGWWIGILLLGGTAYWVGKRIDAANFARRISIALYATVLVTFFVAVVLLGLQTTSLACAVHHSAHESCGDNE
jgi:hypothetical protein